MILSKYAFGAVGNSMIMPKYAFTHSQELFDVVGAVGNSMILPKYASRHSQKLYDIVKVCL